MSTGGGGYNCSLVPGFWSLVLSWGWYPSPVTGPVQSPVPGPVWKEGYPWSLVPGPWSLPLGEGTPWSLVQVISQGEGRGGKRGYPSQVLGQEYPLPPDRIRTRETSPPPGDRTRGGVPLFPPLPPLKGSAQGYLLPPGQDTPWTGYAFCVFT